MTGEPHRAYRRRIPADGPILHSQHPTDPQTLAAAFRAWCGDLTATRVLFTPDVLIAIDAGDGRGYLFDDGWEIEVYIEVGASLFEAQLADPGATRDEPQDDVVWNRGDLLRMALDRGKPFDAVKHLI